MKVGLASRHVASCVVSKNLCPGIRVRLATPLLPPYGILSYYGNPSGYWYTSYYGNPSGYLSR